MTLDELRDAMRAVGFHVERRHDGETTLRAYSLPRRGHPLINPRLFRPGDESPVEIEEESLVIAVYSRNPPGLHRAIREFPREHGIRFIPENLPPGALRLHGEIVIPLRFREAPEGTELDIAALAPALKTVRDHLSAAASRAAAKQLSPAGLARR